MVGQAVEAEAAGEAEQGGDGAVMAAAADLGGALGLPRGELAVEGHNCLLVDAPSITNRKRAPPAVADGARD